MNGSIEEGEGGRWRRGVSEGGEQELVWGRERATEGGQEEF